MLRFCTFVAGALLAFPLHAGGAEDQALGLVNIARSKAGCAALRIEARLTAAAFGHARDMAEQDFFDHKGSDGSRFSTRIARQGYPFRAGAENIAAGYTDPQKTVAQWLQSKGHAKNMLNCGYDKTGIAMYYQPDDAPIEGNGFALRAYWVQVFAK